MTGNCPFTGFLVFLIINLNFVLMLWPHVYFSILKHVYVLIFAIFLHLVSLISLILTMFTDPGYIPKQQKYISWVVESKAILHLTNLYE